MAEIWEERYTNSKGLIESQMNHNRFLLYKDMPNRSLEKVTYAIFFHNREISKDFSKSPQFKKKLNIIYKASSTYDWQDRAIAYDNHRSRLIQEKNFNKLNNFFSEEIDDAIQLPKIIKVELDEIIRQEYEEIIVDGKVIKRKIRPSDKIAMIQKLVNSYDTSVKSVGYIGNCGVSKTSAKNESTVKVKAETKSLFENKESYHKKITDELEDLLE